MTEKNYKGDYKEKNNWNLFSSSEFFSKLLESKDTSLSLPSFTDVGSSNLNEENVHLSEDSFSNFWSSKRNHGKYKNVLFSDSVGNITEEVENGYNDAKDILGEKMNDKKFNQFSSVPTFGSDDVFTSKDWMGHYIINHVDVDYSKPEGLFQLSSDHHNEPLSNSKYPTYCGKVSLPESSSFQSLNKSFLNPRSNGGKSAYDWLYEYNQAISGQKPGRGNDSAGDILSLLDKETVIVSSVDRTLREKSREKRVGNNVASNFTAANLTSNVIPTESDVLMGRGGKSNNHIGNQRYLKEVEQLKSTYRIASKNDKTDWAQSLVDRVHLYGGRFVKYDAAAKNWYEVSNKVARKKTGQAMRENNTADARLQKREKYNKQQRKQHLKKKSMQTKHNRW